MQPPSLHHVARSRTYNILLSLLSLLHNTLKEPCKIKYNKLFYTLEFFYTDKRTHK